MRYFSDFPTLAQPDVILITLGWAELGRFDVLVSRGLGRPAPHRWAGELLKRDGTGIDGLVHSEAGAS